VVATLTSGYEMPRGVLISRTSSHPIHVVCVCADSRIVDGNRLLFEVILYRNKLEVIIDYNEADDERGTQGT